MKAEQSLEELKASCEAICRKLDLPLTSLPRFGGAGMSWTVRFVGDTFVSEEEERGEVFRETLGPSQEDALYGIFECIARGHAHAATAPTRDEDSRRRRFVLREEFLGRASPEWAERCRRRHAQILEGAPFDDSASERADLVSSYMKEGLSYWDARTRAHEKYPPPTDDGLNPDEYEVAQQGGIVFLRKRSTDEPG